MLASANANGMIRLWDPATGKEIGCGTCCRVQKSGRRPQKRDKHGHVPQANLMPVSGGQ